MDCIVYQSKVVGKDSAFVGLSSVKRDDVGVVDLVTVIYCL